MSALRHRSYLLLALTAAVLSVALSAAGPAPHAAPAQPSTPGLPTLGPAPTFMLDSAQGPRLALEDLRGKVLAVTFVFTTCGSTCPVLTAKLADIARSLGSDFGKRYAFVAISVDPLNDTPARLRAYATTFGADAPGWHFLTGMPRDIDEVVRRYGAYAKKTDDGGVEHLFLTSLIDRAGMLRVQYLGTRFDAQEMQRDLQMLSRD